MPAISPRQQAEMWQEDTFDPDRIDLELGWAEGIGVEHRGRLAVPRSRSGPDQGDYRSSLCCVVSRLPNPRALLLLINSC